MNTLALQELTQEETVFFEENGYVGPFQTYTPQEMDAIRAHIDANVLNRPSGFHNAPGQCRHFDDRTVWELCSHPAIVNRTATIFGPNVVLWRSNFFAKPPGGAAVPWHQDGSYWPLDPKINITAWLAIDPATRENSCVRVIPGSHKQYFPDSHFTTEQDLKNHVLTHQTHLEYVDESKAVDIELKPGEFFLFNEKALHYSPPNHSDKRRLGLAIRITTPEVNVDHDALTRNHFCVMLCGEDTHGLNRYDRPFE